jgi:hypothetical protein
MSRFLYISNFLYQYYVIIYTIIISSLKHKILTKKKSFKNIENLIGIVSK